MRTITVGQNKVIPGMSKEKKNVSKLAVKPPSETLKEKQLASFEQGLTEVIMISRGEIKGTPLSELWDE